MTMTKDAPAREATAGLLTTEEAARLLKVSPDAFRIMLRAGEIPADVMVPLSGRRRRVSLVRLEAHLVASIAKASAKASAANGASAPAPDATPDAAAVAKRERTLRAVWDGQPTPSPTIQLPAGVSVGPGGVLRWG
jgi:excisionase family DNA binding protein